jgi:hypothetical protein
MNQDIVLLGLPGLYQNWVLYALDPCAETIQNNNYNFTTTYSSVKWYRKMETDLSNISILLEKNIIINCYVKDENFVWYLYNFLEKTDGVGLSINNLINDLISKAHGTMAFESLLKHLIESYKITENHSESYKNNAAIENFYLLLINDEAEFKIKSGFTHPDCVNLEYRDFENVYILLDKLKHVPNFNKQHFIDSYQLLVSRNQKYITKQKKFINTINNCKNEFDLLETAYLGYLQWKLQEKRLDWFNPEIRQLFTISNWKDICNLANNLYKKIS